MKLELGSYEAQALERALSEWKKLFQGEPVDRKSIRFRDTIHKIYERLLSEINEGDTSTLDPIVPVQQAPTYAARVRAIGKLKAGTWTVEQPRGYVVTHRPKEEN
jgi:hypothetical protein